MAATGSCLFVASALAATLATSLHAADGPTVDATVATISGGALRADLGMQGIALNADRTLLYVGEGTRMMTWSPQTGCSAGTGTPSQSGLTGYVGVFSTVTRDRIADLPLTSGYPIHAELDPASGRVYVVSSPFGVYAFQGTAQVGASSPLGGAPHDIGIDSTNGRAVVTNTFDFSGNSANQTYVTLINLATFQVLNNVNTGGFGPHKAAVDPVRHLAYVSHAEFPKVDVIDTQAGQLLRQIETGLASGGAQNAIDLSRRRLYTFGRVAGDAAGNNDRLVAIDLATEQLIGQLPLPTGAHGTRVDPVTGLIWVGLLEQGMVAVVDPDTLTERARIPVGHCPYYLDIDAERRLAYVTNQGDNTISVLDMTRVPAAGSALPAPANLTQIVSGTTVSLTWSAVSGAVAYDLEAGSRTGLSDLAVLAIATNGFSATVGPGTYYVRVRARNAAGETSSASNEVIVTVGAGCTAAPAAPSGLSASVSGGTVILSWGAPPGSIASHVLEAGSAPELNDIANSDLGSASPAFTASGVPPGNYYVRIRARNACGIGAASNEILVTVQ